MRRRGGGTVGLAFDAPATSGAFAAIVLAVLLLAAPGVALAADPSGTAPPTCAERYPAAGPAGIDLRLACAAGEVVGLVTGSGEPADPEALAAGVRTLAVVLGAGSAVLIAVVVVRRSLGRRLAAATPSGWWSCPGCRSVNPETAARCYRCRVARTPDVPIMRAAGSDPEP